MYQDVLEYLKSNIDTKQEIFEEYKNLIDELNNIEIITIDIMPKLIKEVILNTCNHNEIKDYYDEFKSMFNKYKQQYIYKFEETLEYFCESEELCPHCGETLIYNYHYEFRGEYQGLNSYETMVEQICPYGCTLD